MSDEQQRQNTGRKNAHLTVTYSFRLRKTNMNTYKALVKLQVTTTTTTNSYVLVQAANPFTAKLQLEALYGRANLIHAPVQVK